MDPERRELLLEEAQAIAHVGSFSRDLVTDRVEWSDELYRIVGVDKETFDPNVSDLLDHVHPDDRLRVDATIRSSRTSTEPLSVEYRILRSSGEIRMVCGRGRLITDDSGCPVRVIGTVQDVTDLKKLQEHVLFASRMRAVGTLGAGVAHEINNPLACVMSSIDHAVDEIVALVDTSPERGGASAEQRTRLEDMREILGEARQAAVRIRNIVRDLKTFSRAEDDRTRPVDVRPVLESAINLVWNEIRHRAHLVKNYGDVPAVDANESRLGQVFVNLLINAAQAIPEGRSEHNEIRIVTRTNDAGMVVIEIRDTGVGIAVEDRQHVFDPFFTTKPVGAAIGLGLSICQSIVSSLGGRIALESTVGAGSTFEVQLPPTQKTIEPQVKIQRGSEQLGRRGRVLVIDDEAPLLRQMHRNLSRYHNVTSVTRGADALVKFQAGDRYDAIVCDLMMPEITGMDLHAELVRIAPDQADGMIFITGGAFTDRAREFLETVPNPRLEKPFEVKNLQALIRSLVRSK